MIELNKAAGNCLPHFFIESYITELQKINNNK